MAQKGKIHFNGNGRTFPCNVVVVTDDGAVVKPIKGTGLPLNFILELADGRRFDCEVLDWMGELAALKFGNEDPIISN